MGASSLLRERALQRLQILAPRGSAQLVIGEATYCLPLGDLIDLKAESARIAKELAKNADEIARIEKKLGNPQFVAKAAPEVVDAEREKLGELSEARGRLDTALARVRDAGQ